MNLTTEQLEIIDKAKNLKPNEILKIQAIAGSGKTSTLKEIANALPNSKFLYLAFNKAIVEEVKSKMPKNVEIKTIHSLAYAYAKRKFGNFDLIPKLKFFDIEPFFSLSRDNLIELLKEFESFCKSSLTLNDVNPRIREIFDLIISKDIPFSHDFYLKYFELNQEGVLRKYDILMLDEAQDTNVVMLNVFLNNPCSKILVGDSFQNIYGFNHTIDALISLKTDFSMRLNFSFRSNQRILDYANFFLNTFSYQKQPKMLSFRDLNANLDESMESQTIQNEAIISRTNVGIIDFISGISKQDSKHLQDYQLLKEPITLFELIFALSDFKEKFTLPQKFSFLNEFKDIDEIDEYAKKTMDIELANAVKILEKYSIEQIKNLYKIAIELHQNTEAKKFITNAHQSKGLEWDKVTLLQDFPQFTEMCIFELDKKLYWNPDYAKNGFDWASFFYKLQQELNLFYVAITRAKHILIDTSKNKTAKNFIDKNNVDILEFYRMRQNGDFSLILKEDNVTAR